jgi:GT2 family glycosyltransferase
MSPRIAAVVLARDRPEVAQRTIDAIAAQDPRPDALILVGNDATPEVLDVFRRAGGDVLALPENGGAAGGFAAGLQRAVDRGDIDLAVCFDDDATPLPGCIAALRDAATTLPDVGTAGAVAHDGEGRLAWAMHADDEPAPAETLDEVRAIAARRGSVEVAGMCWHGLMVPVEVLRREGVVWADLFHQYEDAEFGLRMRRAGLRNYLVPDAEVLHPMRPPSRKLHFLGREIAITNQSPAKEYLTIRNDLVVRKRYNGLRFWWGTGPLILVRGLLTTLQLDLPRLAALRHVFLRAVLDAARGRLGPPPERTATLSPMRRGT